MKTAISIPDDTFVVAEQLAHKLGTTRSKLYTMAIESYVRQQTDQAVTDKLNEVFDSEDTGLDEWSRTAARRTLRRTDW